MELLIHFNTLPAGKTLEDVKLELSELLEDDGALLGSSPRHIDLDLLGEDDNRNPKYAILAVRHYLRSQRFPSDTTIELAGTPVGIYE